MNSMLVAIKQVNTTLVDMNSNLGGKIDQMDENFGRKMDRMLQKQDDVLLEVKDIAQNGNKLLVEVKDMNRKIGKVRDNEIIEMKNDIVEVKAALRAKGIIYIKPVPSLACA